MSDATEINPADLDPAKAVVSREMTNLLAVTDKVNAFLSPTYQQDLSLLAGKYLEITKVEDAADREVAFRAAQDLQKARTKQIDPDHEECKGPALAVTRVLDERKRTLTMIVKPEEDRLRALVKGWDDEQARIEATRLAAIKKRTDDRVQAAMELGIRVDLELAQTAEDDVWIPYFAGIKDERTKELEEQRLEQERTQARQKLLLDRMEAAAKVGGVLSREEAEFLTEEAWTAKLAGWQADFDRRQAEAAELAEVNSFLSRARSEGFMDLTAEAIRSWFDREAGFMVWIEEATRLRRVTQENNLKATRLISRSEELKEGEIVSVSVMQSATDEEWAVIMGQIKAERRVPVASMTAAPVNKELDEMKSAPIQTPTVPAGTWGSPTAAAIDRKAELVSICKDFASFGKSLPSEELKAQLRPIYNRMKVLAELL